MEQALQDSEALFRTLAENSPAAIFIYQDECFRYVNQIAEDLIGYSAAELTSMYFFDVVHPDYREMVKERGLARQRGEKVPIHYEFKVIRADGTERWVDFAAGMINYRGKPAGLGTAYDITDRKQAEAALKESEEHLRQTQKLEALGQLASGIAHDFNNILAIIIGHATLLKQGKQPPDKVTHSLDTIEKTSQRGADLVKQLLTLSRKAEPVTASINFGEIVNEVVHLLAETFPKTIEVETALDAEPLIVMADASQINQVLMNLCLNARDAMPQGGLLHITIQRASGQQVRKHHADASGDFYAELRVTDTGIGMDKATIERIFEPFYTTKELGRGTGLGLTTVHSIIRNHNGFINVESQPGRGTTFIIYLPLPASLSATKPTISAEMPAFERGNETILLIEDEKMHRRTNDRRPGFAGLQGDRCNRWPDGRRRVR